MRLTTKGRFAVTAMIDLGLRLGLLENAAEQGSGSAGLQDIATGGVHGDSWIWVRCEPVWR